MVYEFDDFVLDTGARQLRRADATVHLSPKAFDLLAFLIAERPRAIRKQELYDRLWPATYVVDANLPVLIREVRSALDDSARTMIRTVHGTGYAFNATVAESKSTRRAEPAQCLHLILVDTQEFRLTEGENLVGREPTAEVFLPSASVSRRHAVITVRGDEATVADLRSKNGTFIGPAPVHAESVVADGNVIRVGEVITRYRRCLPGEATDTIHPS